MGGGWKLGGERGYIKVELVAGGGLSRFGVQGFDGQCERRAWGIEWGVKRGTTRLMAKVKNQIMGGRGFKHN